jgi:transcriptional regulator with XRE-family HTH domain
MIHRMDTYGSKYNAVVGDELQAERAAKHLTVRELSEQSGIVKGTLQRYLSGHRDIPVPALYAIANALDLEPAVILDRASARLGKELGRSQP